MGKHKSHVQLYTSRVYSGLHQVVCHTGTELAQSQLCRIVTNHVLVAYYNPFK